MTSDSSFFWTVYRNPVIRPTPFLLSLLGAVLYVGRLGTDVLLQSLIRHSQTETERQVREADSETTLPLQVRS